MASDVPLTVRTAFQTNYGFGATFGVYPNKKHYPANQVAANTYWFLVVDRFDLANTPVDVVSGSNNEVPPAVLKYNDARYMIIVSTMALLTPNLPQGALRDFLSKHGGDDNLNRLEQLYHQFGCGSFGPFAFAMVGILGDGGGGFATSSIESFERTFLTLTLHAAQVDGKTMYTPIADSVHTYTPVS